MILMTSKFDRATQALRQTGSAFKPFVYAAAMDRGVIDLEDTIVDIPVSFGSYSPEITTENTRAEFPSARDGRFPEYSGGEDSGDARRLNLIPYVRNFGITSRMDPYLPLALGAADVTLLEMTSAYSTFPNDGVRVDSTLHSEYYGLRWQCSGGKPSGTQGCPSSADGEKDDGVAAGTHQGRHRSKALELKRPLAGKTGTTNDFTDAWFMGFTPSLTTGVWVGFDEKVTLGDKETGARAALPIWMERWDRY
jgi:penicillin-binding protein 1A